MFESILIRPNSSRLHPIDIGQVMENVFFYKKTVLHAGRKEFLALMEYIDTDTLESLLKNTELTIQFNNSHTGVGIYNLPKGECYSVDVYSHQNLDIEKQLYNIYLEHSKDKSKSSDFSKRIGQVINPYTLPPKFSSVLDIELQDDRYRKKIVLEHLKYYNPNIDFDGNTLSFELKNKSDNLFQIDTNIDFSIFKNSSISSILLNLINTAEDLQVIAENNSEISLPVINSNLVRIKVNDVIEKSIKSLKEVEIFNHYIYDESILLREQINNKVVSVKELLPIFEKAEKYKDWLSSLPENKNLLKEYIKKVGEKSWIESLPAKSVRFYLATGINVILNMKLPQPLGTIASVGLSGFNSFLIDKLFKKWKPNQFIENELVPFVKK